MAREDEVAVGFLFGNVDENNKVDADYLDQVGPPGRCCWPGGGRDWQQEGRAEGARWFPGRGRCRG